MRDCCQCQYHLVHVTGCSEMELLVELPAVGSAVSFPLRCTQRIKYTCFDVSKNLLIFGATSGGLYVFNRDPCTFIQLIPNKDGSIIKIKISPDEKSVSFATHRGYVCVCDCGKNTGSYIKSPILQISKEHIGNEVTFMIWNENGNELYIGDDVGTVSILHISTSFTKNVFQTLALSLMKLDSRIVQIDVNSNLLLVSTLTRCFICDILKEHYAQIGQKLRDGEFGACFLYRFDENHVQSIATEGSNGKITNKPFSIVADDDKIKCDDTSNIKVFCARPGSRLWEVKIDGTVICTHQFKEPLSISPTNIYRSESINGEIANGSSQNTNNPKSLNFPLLYMFKNKFIFTFRKDGIFIFDPNTSAVVLWSDKYKDIIDCKVINDLIYIWRSNGNLTILFYNTIETFLIKCYLEQNYTQCARICDIYADALIPSIPAMTKIHVLKDLGEKLTESGEIELFNKINHVLEEINKNDNNTCLKSKSGIYTVENNFIVNSTNCDFDNDSSIANNKTDLTLFQISPVIKEFGNTVTDRLSSKLKKTWDHLEDKMKKIKLDRIYNVPLDVRNINGDVTHQTNGNSDVDRIDNTDEDLIDIKNQCNGNGYDDKPMNIRNFITLYDLIKNNSIFEIEKEIVSCLSKMSCDINNIFQLLVEFEIYIISRGHSSQYSGLKCSEIFMQYVNNTPCLNETIDVIIDNKELSSCFLQSFINVNSDRVCMSTCECGYPLPGADTDQIPIFLNAMNIFIEKKWNSDRSEECFHICQNVPYLWKTILLLNKGEGLTDILIILLQMLDEELLYLYLPHFTIETWKHAVRLFGTLKKYQCLNCGKSFEHNHLNLHKNTFLDWDTIGVLMIRSIGPINACDILKINTGMIPREELTLKFYHSCFFTTLFNKYNSTVTNELIETIYQAYDYEDAIKEMCKFLTTCFRRGLPHTALPLSVASKSTHWGLNIVNQNESESTDVIAMSTNRNRYRIGMSFDETLDFIEDICPNKDCLHCGVSLTSKYHVVNGNLWVFSCGHTFHGVCLKVLKIKLCPLCSTNK